MKLIDAWYEESTGKSYATVEHLGRRYQGMSKLHPEEEHASKFTGCRYAEIRAQIKALKAERQSLIWKCEECRKFVKACSQYKNWDKESPVAKVVYKQLNARIKQVNELTNQINQLEWDLNIAIRQQNMIHTKLAGMRAQTTIIDEVCPEQVKAEIDNLS